MNRWKFKIGIVAAFVLGLVIGCGSTGWWFAHGLHDFHGPPDKVERRIMDHLSWYLHLTDDQRRKLEPIVHQGSQKLEALRDKAEPEIRHIVADGLEQSKSILTPEQYEKISHRIQEMQNRWDHRHDPN